MLGIAIRANCVTASTTKQDGAASNREDRAVAVADYFTRFRSDRE